MKSTRAPSHLAELIAQHELLEQQQVTLLPWQNGYKVRRYDVVYEGAKQDVDKVLDLTEEHKKIAEDKKAWFQSIRLSRIANAVMAYSDKVIMTTLNSTPLGFFPLPVQSGGMYRVADTSGNLIELPKLLRAFDADYQIKGGVLTPVALPPAIGTTVPDGTIYQGYRAGEDCFVTAEDAKNAQGARLGLTFNQARLYAQESKAHGHTDWELPPVVTLNDMFISKDTGDFKGTYYPFTEADIDKRMLERTGHEWLPAPHEVDNLWYRSAEGSMNGAGFSFAQKFSLGTIDRINDSVRASVRLVRKVRRPGV